MSLIDWLMIVGYFAVLATVVVVTLRRRRIASGEDLFLGGRSVGWLAVGASLFAANIGSEHLIGLAGSGASVGLSQAHWELNSWIIVMMAWVFLPFYYKSGVTTMPEFLERRFGAKARWLLSLVSLAAYVLTKISVTVFAGAVFFQVMLPDLSLNLGGTEVGPFWIGAAITVTLAGIYSSIGGLSAVVYTDIVQSGIILLGTLSVTGFALHYLGTVSPAGGWAVLKETIRATGNTENFGIWHALSHPTVPWLGILIASATAGVWYWCTDQFIVQRTLAARNLKEARRGVLFGSLLRFSPVFLFLVPGMLGFALHHNHVEIAGKVFAIPMKTLADGSQVLNGDTVFPTLVQTILPTGFRGLVVAGMVAALMSSLASLFNSVSTLFTMDVYMKLRPETSPRKQVLVGRLTTVGMTVLGLLWLPVMKTISTGGLYQYLMAVQSFLAPPIVAVFVGGLLCKRMNLRGAVWGLGVGFCLGMAKLAVNATCAGSAGLLGRIAAFQDYYFSGVLLVLSGLVIAVASLTSPLPDEAHLRGLNFACLDERFRAENRASWGWREVAASVCIVGLVLAAYAYFTTWLG